MRSEAGPDHPRIGLGDECERFLDGTYESYLEEMGLPVPLWARVNMVAHADVLELVAAASPSARSAGWTGRPSTWGEARAHLAEAVLRSAAANDATPSEIQEEALLPLESQLARRGHNARATRDRRRDVRRLIALVEAALPIPAEGDGPPLAPLDGPPPPSEGP